MSSPAERVRVGVIGAGWWSTQHHLPSLATYDHAEVTAIADPDEAKLGRAADVFEVAGRFTDHRTLLASGVADAVVIAVPHLLHHELARDALDAGVHVLLEKPLTLRGADAWDLVDRARASGVHLMCGYTFQFTRHAPLVHDAVRSGRIGDLRLVTGVFSSMVESYLRGRPDDYAGVFGFPITGPRPDTYSSLERGGGQGYTQVTHPMGMVFWVTGARPVEVTAQMERFDLAVDLADAISFRLDTGAVGTIASTGTIRPGQDQHQALHYYGSDGYVVHDLIHGTLAITDAHGTESPDPLVDDEIYPSHAPARGLVDLVRGAGENRAPAEPAAVTVDFLEAAYASAASGGAPVRL